MLLFTKVSLPIYLITNMNQIPVGREASTGRKVAIKKIKVGQFKDGLDMSAIREVKYLRELKHQNVIEVWVQCDGSYVFRLIPCYISWTYSPLRRISI